jgi:hypothetical protein
VICAPPARPSLAQKSIAFICHTNYQMTHLETKTLAGGLYQMYRQSR